VKEVVNFFEATVLGRLRCLPFDHSIDVMHIEKNVCESLLETLLNTDGKIRDHGHALVDLEKMGIGPKLWLDDELPTSCITLSKNERVILWVLEKN
jgi:hypothetical protein